MSQVLPNVHYYQDEDSCSMFFLPLLVVDARTLFARPLASGVNDTPKMLTVLISLMILYEWSKHERM